jgi:S1-C subfamily serine protease
VEVLVGGSFLRHFVAHVDYADRLMKLSPNTQGGTTPRAPPDELVAPGFTICKHTATADDDRSGMVIIDVFEGTDAERKGIEAGSLLVGVDGQRVDQMEAAEVRELFRSLGAGTSVRLVLAGSPQDIPLDVTIENLLPEIR